MKAFSSLLILLALNANISASAPTVDYRRDVRPLLARRCYSCHGPLKKRSGLRLDSVKGILKGGDTGPAVVPGKPEASLLVGVLTGKAGFRMPPSGKPLTAAEITLLRTWIAQGARGPTDEQIVDDPTQHWSYRPVQRPAIPTVKNGTWVHNPIDAFVAFQHEKRGLQLRPAASRALWLRRVYLDLVGVPPTQEALSTFLADTSPNAYEKVVDHLLSSPRYGERWGRHWMDVWRYSDWYGRRASGEIRYSQRHIWRWRDYIVESLNADKGYDRMILEMLAGDELAPEDPDVLRATGFVGRNWYKFDRDVWLRETVEHTAMGFLALTLKCARCHDHKFDPITQKDYYRFRAFFEPHQVRLDPVSGEKDLKKDGLARIFDANPRAPTYLFIRGDDRRPDKSNPLKPGVPAALSTTQPRIKGVSLPVSAYYPALQPDHVRSLVQKAQGKVQAAQAGLMQAQESVRIAKQKLTASGKKAEPPPREKKDSFVEDDFSKPRPEFWKIVHGEWKYERGRLTQKKVTDWAMLLSHKEHPRNFQARVRYRTTASGGTYHSVGLAFDVVKLRDFQAVYTSARGGAVQAFYRQAGKEVYPGSAIVRHPIRIGQEVTVDLAVRENLLNVWVDGQLKIVQRMPLARQAGQFALWVHSGTAEFQKLQVEKLRSGTRLAQSKKSTLPSPFGKRAPADWKQALQQAQQNAHRAEKRLALALAEADSVQARISAEQAKHGHTMGALAQQRALAASKAERLVALRRAELAIWEAEQEVALLKNGRAAGTKPGQAELTANKKLLAARKMLTAAQAASQKVSMTYTPLGPLFPKTSTGRRLALARWIANKDNPRTARVAVNQMWLRHFGQALVPTVSNFGLSGRPPSHPQLLDWLAADLMEHGWSMKHLHRLIVTSNTYRLTSTPGSTLHSNQKIDPENRYLWRMNSRRMEAEVVRDSILYLSGQLDQRMGGPELPQNLGLTSGRRSLYFRHTPDDKMEFLEIFDLANPDECYQRNQSVVPQQALAILNSTLALTEARRLARQLGSKVNKDDVALVGAAFTRVLGREPTSQERQLCVRFLREQTHLLAKPRELTTFPSGARAPLPPAVDPALRARENLVHVLFNHNDFVTIR